MNGQLELRIITHPYSEGYWGYFRRLVFGNSLTKHIKLSSFSYSVVIFFLPISHIPPCFRANPPDFPRLIGPRDLMGQWCGGHFHIHCSDEASFLEYLRSGHWWVSNASSELKPVHMGQLVVSMVLVRVWFARETPSTCKHRLLYDMGQWPFP